MFESLKTLDFTQLFKHSTNILTSFSSNGNVFATALENELTVYETKSKLILQIYVCDNPIDWFKCSPDSDLICCSTLQGSIFQVWSLKCCMWKFKIVERPLAITNIVWSPDSSHLLTFSEFHVKSKVWSLQTATVVTELENVKSVNDCIAFTHCKKYMAVLQRKNSSNFVSIFTCYSWELLKKFAIDVKDSSGIYFSPSELVISIVEKPCIEFKMVLYYIDGRKVGSVSKDSIWGITNLSFSPLGQYVALNSTSPEVSFIERRTCREISVITSPESVCNENITVYKVTPGENVEIPNTTKVFCDWEFVKILKERPVGISQPVESEVKVPKKKLDEFVPSFDGRYFAFVHYTAAKVLHLVDTDTMQLSHILIHHMKIKSICWHPSKNILAICAGSSFLHLWTPTGCISASAPFQDSFSIIDVRWCPSADCIVLNGKEHSCLLYFPGCIDSS